MRSDAPDRRTAAGWLLVGFALGGFFDGIVLHQILQWHHLLSGLDGPRANDLRFQVMADGLFHVVMYLLAIAGAVLLVAARATGHPRPPSSRILRLSLIGFGTWHVVDAVFVHWLLGLHRIRMDSTSPLAWDVAWLLVFGIVPLGLAAVLRGSKGPPRGTDAALASVTILAGLIAASGPGFAEARDTIIVFPSQMQPASAMAAVGAAGTTMKWTDASGTIWGVEAVSWAGLVTLHLRGALVVSQTPVLAGCLAATRVELPAGKQSCGGDVGCGV